MFNDLPKVGLLWLLAAIAYVIYWSKERSTRRGLPYPPGPRPLPLVGNLFDQPYKSPWLVYHRWGKEYGNIVSFSAMGRRTVILNSAEVVSDLIEKRSSVYSDRVRFPMLNELVGWNWNFCFMPYGQRWRERRRTLNRHLSPSALRWLHPVHTKHSQLLLQQLLHFPSKFENHLRQAVTASIMESVYDLEIKDKSDPFYKIAEIAMASLSHAGIFGTFYVDFFPFLKYVPSWLPGAGFQQQAVEWGKYVRAMRDDGLKSLEARMKMNEARPCIAKKMLDSIDPNDDRSHEIIRDATGITFGAGADTSICAILIFFLAMALYPDAQRKAQEEVDHVVGRDRLPDFSDQPNLPYVNALCKEVVRWQNITPLSVEHAASEDDVYEGYFIPKGSVVVANTWAITHDPEIYPEPEEFRPDRFLKDGKLDPKVRDPYIHTFGPGRRICPGRYFALNSLYSVVTNVLACFNIEPPTHGKLEPRMMTGVISYPEPFDVVIKPRYTGVEALVENAAADVQEVS